MKKVFKKALKFILQHKATIFVLLIFLCELFLRFYQFDQKNPFGYDQVDNAWAAKNLIVNHQFPLVGMVAKGNSGIYIGPLYYYLIAIFYWLFNLNPIASGIFAGVTSIFTFWVLFYFVRKLFNTEVALIAVLINTFIFSGIMFDRVQWPVAFIPSVSLIIFYLLYKVLLGQPKYLVWLAVAVGFMFSVHFTVIFFPIIILLTLPLFPRTKETVRYLLLSVPVLILFLAPNIIYQLVHKGASGTLVEYIKDNLHGFHLRRVLQLTDDALIQFNNYLGWTFGKYLKYLVLPIFFVLYLYNSVNKKKLIFVYLILLWFIVPWLVFALYRGEISDYYFSINRFIALATLAYLIYRVWNLKFVLTKAAVVVGLVALCLFNLGLFWPYQNETSLQVKEKEALSKISLGEKINYQQGVPEAYIYYYLTTQKDKNVH